MPKIATIVFILFIMTGTLAAQAPSLKSFSAGTAISSADVNANFAALSAAVVALQTKLAADEALITALQSTSAIDASVTSPAGYLNLHGGLVLQWGDATDVATQGSKVITFPKAFAHGLLFAAATASNGNNTVNDWSITASSLTSVTFLRANWSTQNNASAFMWFAVGY